MKHFDVKSFLLTFPVYAAVRIANLKGEYTFKEGLMDGGWTLLMVAMAFIIPIMERLRDEKRAKKNSLV